MKVQFELTIGQNKFTLIEDVETHADFFKKLDFYSALPKTGPNGEDDLVLRHRKAKTKDGKPCDYFSIVSQKAKQEYKFGQSQGVNGQLFPKGWEPLYNASGTEQSDDQSDDQSVAPGTNIGLGAPSAQPKAVTKASASAGLGASATPAPAAPSATAVAPNAAVKEKAANVLSKFGI